MCRWACCAAVYVVFDVNDAAVSVDVIVSIVVDDGIFATDVDRDGYRRLHGEWVTIPTREVAWLFEDTWLIGVAAQPEFFL